MTRYLGYAAAACVALVLASFASSAHASEDYSEDAVKAAYLFRFAGYVDWPDARPPGTSFTIAVLGSPGVARELRHLLPGHSINGRAAQVREITGVQDMDKPQILYVGMGYTGFLRGLRPADARSMLVVTDEEGGLNAGSALNFLLIDRRVRFEVSLTAADRSGLKISSELLGVAVRVRGGGRQSRGGCLPFNPYEAIGDGCAVRLVDRGAWRQAPYSGRSG